MTAAPSDPVAADLLVDAVRIRGFRSLVDVEIRLEETATLLVGENNSGKSSALDAIATACGHRRPIQDDLHRREDGSAVEEATIDLYLRSKGSEFRDEVLQRLENEAGPGPGPGEWAGIRAELKASREGTFLTFRRNFIRWDPTTSVWEGPHGPVPERVSELLAAQLLSASRDLISDLDSRTSDWGRVFMDLGIAPGDRSALESEMKTLSDKLREASPIVDGLQQRLSQVANAQSGVDSIELVPLPLDLEDLARSIDLVVTMGRRTGLPLRFQGLGSRSLAALMVFRALCEFRVGQDLGVKPHILTLLEEPEAHLHPQAQTAVGRLLRDLPGQIVVATHSDVLVAGAAPQTVRRMTSGAAGAEVHHLTVEGAKKTAVFRRFVERPLGEIFFAKMVVLVDGTAERISLPIALEPLLGKDPAGAGVAVVDLQGMTSETLEKVVAALDELGGIPWLVFLDNDADGWSAIEGVQGSDGAELDENHAQVVVAGDKQLETLLMDAGYEDEVRTVAETYAAWGPAHPEHGQPRVPPAGDADAADGCLEFLKDNKGWAAELVMNEVVTNGKPLPTPIVEFAARIRASLGMPEPDTDRYRLAVGAQAASAEAEA